MRTLLFGECLVDLVCERAVASASDADAFVPHLGGAAATIALTAAGGGADVALAGGTGDDAWGRWLRAQLEAAGVDLRWFAQPRGSATAVSLVTAAEDGAARAVVHGDAIAAAAAVLADVAEEAVAACDALVLTTNTLVGEAERATSMAAREQLLGLGRPLILHANLELSRWGSPAEAASVVRELVRDAFVVVVSAESARLLTGERAPDAAAAGLLAGGAQHVVVSLGSDGALLRGGGMRLDARPAAATPVDRSGAIDAFCGEVVSHLARTDYYGAALAAALPRAVHAYARTSERHGAVPRP